MRRLTLAGLLPALMILISGCGEGETPVAATPDKSISAVPATPAAKDLGPAKVESATTSATESPDAKASSTPDSNGSTVAAAEIKPVDAPAADTVPIATLEEPEVAPNELHIGDAAPPIFISKWVKGEPVTSFNPEKVHVVEFWATWCGPCLMSMPHIAELQVEYGDKVTFIGVTDEDDATVSGFMEETARGSDKKWSEVLTYTIALDDEHKTNMAYMQAAGQNGIPCAFIVGRSGKIEWIGHPASIEDPLSQVVEGSWDSAKFLAMQEAREQTFPKLQRAAQGGDFKAAIELIDPLVAQFPEDKDFPRFRFQLLLSGGMTEDANKAATGLIEASKDDAMMLNQLAWLMATGSPEPGIDLNLAHSAAQRATELTEEKDASIIDTLARITFLQGKVADAAALQKKAVELSPEDEQIKASLDEYEAALKAASEPAAAADAPATEEEPADAATPPGN